MSTPAQAAPAQQRPLAKQMRAAVLRAPMRFAVEQQDLPEPRSGQVRIRVSGCGVCGSESAAWQGAPWFQYPLPAGAPGHEAWGVVEKVASDVTTLSVGDRVAALTFRGYAEYDIAFADQLVRPPADMAAIPFPGEPLACALNVFRRSIIAAGDTVVIIGIGFLGALLTRLASTAGARVLAVTRRPFALDVACAMGAQETVPLRGLEDTAADILRRVEGDGAGCVIEAVGRQDTLDLAARVTATRGRLVIAGYHQDGTRTVDMQSWNWRGIDVINAHERDPAVYVRGMSDAIAAVQSGRLDPQQLITHDFALDELPVAMHMMRTRPDGFLKAVVRP